MLPGLGSDRPKFLIRPQSVNNQWANPLLAPKVFGPTPGINIFPESAGRNECETGWPYHARLGLPVQSSNSAAHVRRPAMAGAVDSWLRPGYVRPRGGTPCPCAAAIRKPARWRN